MLKRMLQVNPLMKSIKTQLNEIIKTGQDVKTEFNKEIGLLKNSE